MEFREMKEQFCLLKEHLDKQVEINEKQLRRAIDEGLSSLHRRDRMGLTLCVVVAFLLPLSVFAQGYSYVFAGVTFLLLSFNALQAYLMKFRASRNFDQLDLITTSRRLLKYKHEQTTYIFYSMPVLAVWILWYLYEIGMKLGIDSVKGCLIMLSCMLLGGITGGLIGYFTFYRPSMRDADRVLNQIKEITNTRF